jgi:hypothetical protein
LVDDAIIEKAIAEYKRIYSWQILNKPILSEYA